MTEREKFEKVFPVPVSMVWNGFTYAIVDAHEISSCWDYQLRWETWQAARATPALTQGVEEWIGEHGHYTRTYGETEFVVGVEYIRAYLSGMAIVPVDGFVIQKGSDEYNEIVVTGPDLGMQTFWPDDAAYGLMKSMLAATKEKGE